MDSITLEEIMNDHAVLLVKEAQDKSLIDEIGSQHVSVLKPKLIEWVSAGKPNVFPIMTLDIQPPTKCSDGISRGLSDYITFCSGKPIHQHVAALQLKLVGIQVSFANINGQVSIVVSA